MHEGPTENRLGELGSINMIMIMIMMMMIIIIIIIIIIIVVIIIIIIIIIIWLAARRLIAILSLARPPRDPKSSFRSLLKQLFFCETRVRANPSPVIFAGVLASKIRKIEIKIQSQRDEASPRLVKHNITISLHSFLKRCSVCLFDFNDRREVYLKVFQHVVAKHCASRSLFLNICQPHPCLNGFFLT